MLNQQHTWFSLLFGQRTPHDSFPTIPLQPVTGFSLHLHQSLEFWHLKHILSSPTLRQAGSGLGVQRPQQALCPG